VVSAHVLDHVMSLGQSKQHSSIDHIFYRTVLARGRPVAIHIFRQLSSTEHVFCPELVLRTRRSVESNEAEIR